MKGEGFVLITYLVESKSISKPFSDVLKTDTGTVALQIIPSASMLAAVADARAVSAM